MLTRNTNHIKTHRTARLTKAAAKKNKNSWYGLQWKKIFPAIEIFCRISILQNSPLTNNQDRLQAINIAVQFNSVGKTPHSVSRDFSHHLIAHACMACYVWVITKELEEIASTSITSISRSQTSWMWHILLWAGIKHHLRLWKTARCVNIAAGYLFPPQLSSLINGLCLYIFSSIMPVQVHQGITLSRFTRVNAYFVGYTQG